MLVLICIIQRKKNIKIKLQLNIAKKKKKEKKGGREMSGEVN